MQGRAKDILMCAPIHADELTRRESSLSITSGEAMAS